MNLMRLYCENLMKGELVEGSCKKGETSGEVHLGDFIFERRPSSLGYKKTLGAAAVFF